MILVTGGTGLVGSHLLFSLSKSATRIRAIHRKGSDIEAVHNIFKTYPDYSENMFQKIEWVEADISDIPALEIAFEGISEVYHCAAYVSFNPSKYHILKKVNIEGTANIVNCAIHFGINKLCYVSSVATLSKKPNELTMDENSFWNPDEKNSVYAISKYGGEMEVWRGTQEGLDVIIVNPGIIFGISPNKDGSTKILELGKRGISFYPPGSAGIVDVRDVVEIMIKLMNSQIKNERFVVVGKNITYRNLLTKTARLFRKNPPTRRLSKGIMNILSALDGIIHRLFRTRRKIPKDAVRAMFKSLDYDKSKITEVLNFTFIPIDETLEYVLKQQSSD